MFRWAIFVELIQNDSLVEDYALIYDSKANATIKFVEIIDEFFENYTGNIDVDYFPQFIAAYSREENAVLTVRMYKQKNDPNDRMVVVDYGKRENE